MNMTKSTDKRLGGVCLADAILLPFRGLFIGTERKWGLTSIRDERMQMVASFCKGRVLDVGCGPNNYFINNYIGEKGIGIDVFPYDGVENIVDDMENLPFDSDSFDTVTLIAVGGHIPKEKRVPEFKEFTRVLKPGGRLIMTEGEPVTQYLRHKWQHFYLGLKGEEDVDSERGMDEDEEYCMPLKEIRTYLNTPPLKFYLRKRFMWGLNNVYIGIKK